MGRNGVIRWQPSPDVVSDESGLAQRGEKSLAPTQNALQKGRAGELATAEVLAVEPERVGQRHGLCVPTLFLEVDRKKLLAAQFGAKAQEGFGAFVRADGQRGREGFATILAESMERTAEGVSEAALAPVAAFGGTLKTRSDHLPPLLVVGRVDEQQNPLLFG